MRKQLSALLVLSALFAVGCSDTGDSDESAAVAEQEPGAASVAEISDGAGGIDEGAANLEAGVKYLEENEKRGGVVTLESGIQIEVFREGEGPSPVSGQTVRLHYRGTLIDGTEFDSSYGGSPAEFSVDGVIAGFSEAIQTMSVGGHIRVVIPSDLAYGESGASVIGPNQTLIFEIELLEIL